MVNFAFACDDGRSGEGSLALTQFTADENLFQTSSLGDRALNISGVEVSTGFGPGNLTSLYWNYRSRVTPYVP